MSGVLLEPPLSQWFTDDGLPNAFGTVTTYAAGTTTLQPTFSDLALTTPNPNPLTLDAFGKATIYLSAVNYKIDVTDANGVSLNGYPMDNVPGSLWQGLLNTSGTITPVANANSFANQVSATIQKAATGIHALFANLYVRIPTINAGAASLTEAATVLIEGAPSVGNSTYALHVQSGASRFDGPIFSTSPISVACNFRLTLTTGTPVTTADVTAATTLFFTPYLGNTIALYNGSAWILRTSAEVSIAVPATTNQMYDVFVFDNAGVVTLELTAWTNDTTPAVALTTQDGILVKSGALTRRYVGSFRTTAVSGQTEDSFTKRFVWNYYNRVLRTLKRFETADTWVYSTAAYRQAGGLVTNQVECVIGRAEVELVLTLTAMSSNSAANDNTFASISDQATTVSTTPDANVTGQVLLSNASVTQITPGQAELRKYPAIGHHVFGWLEQGSGSNVTTWYGDNGAPTKYQAGLLGTVAG